MFRMIFTVTPGRSGTMYLANLMQLVAGVNSNHEISPNFNECMRDIQSNPGLATKFWLERKLPAIQWQMDRAGDSVYFEASHIFCEGFLEPLVGLGYKPDLILLHRSFREIALSRWRRKDIPGRTQVGLEYMLKPDDPVYLPIPNWKYLSDYQLCYWHVLEIAERQIEYWDVATEYGGKAIVTTLDDIRDPRGFNILLSHLDLPSIAAEDHFDIKINAWDRDLDKMPEYLDEQERQVKKLVNR